MEQIQGNSIHSHEVRRTLDRTLCHRKDIGLQIIYAPRYERKKVNFFYQRETSERFLLLALFIPIVHNFIFSLYILNLTPLPNGQKHLVMRDSGFLKIHKGSSSHNWSLFLRSFPTSKKFPPLFYFPGLVSPFLCPLLHLPIFSLFFFPSYYPFLVLTLSCILDCGFLGWTTYIFSPPSTNSLHESD